MYIHSLPNSQGWRAGGYHFYVADDGTLTYGKPGEVPQPLPAVTVPYYPISGSGTISITSPYRYHINCSGGNLTLTLPLSSAAPYQVLQFKRIDTTSNTVTIQRSGSDLIDGETIQTLGQWESISLHSDSISNWYIS